MLAENKNLLTSNKGEYAMLSKSSVLKVALVLVLLLLVMSIALGMPVLADGGGGLPYPPDNSPSSDGDSYGSSLVFTLLIILQFAV
jgi:hypothetical protein